MAWCELFKDAVCAKLDMHDSDEKAKPFYRDMTGAEFAKTKAIVGTAAAVANVEVSKE